MTDAQLQRMWEDIKKAPIEQSSDVKAIVLSAEAYKRDPKRQPCTKESCPYPYLQQYIHLLPYKKDIAAAAKKFDVDKAALTALLIIESNSAEVKRGWPEAVARYIANAVEEDGANASLGPAQLEIYKARKVLKKYFSQNIPEGISGDIKIAKMLMDYRTAIPLAAAYMRYLMDTRTVIDATTGRPRPITDWEAVLAYCGCTGNADRFSRWVQSGYRPSQAAGTNAVNRYRDLWGWAASAATEYWQCVAANC